LKLTTARYYRPNGHNIHRLPDAKPEDEWGVSPDEENRVEIEDDAYIELIQQWERSTYPVMKTKSKDASPEPPTVLRDPQMERAIDVLKQPKSVNLPVPEARKAA